MKRLELWTGPEASCVRVGQHVTDQLELSGFARRPEDLLRLASVGAARVRFPMLWERTDPQNLGPQQADWRWADATMPRLSALDLKPVLGLVHHGGGPLAQGVLDRRFPAGLAAYAAAVAQRFPWVDAYTPVNEPLTTARFSALYGVWHPHAASDRTFVQALLNQLRATVLSMRAVRTVHPGAALIQTEDLGKVSGTDTLAQQVDFENLRRWLTFDLLCGHVDEQHGLWDYLRWAGASERDILWFAEQPCPPDVLGLNIYVTSERYLDDRLERYPDHLHGGNGRQRYVDTETVRLNPDASDHFFARLLEAHQRYHLPLALTEVHLGCTRDEQLRWLYAAWQDAVRARAAGADVRAVTAWATFGSSEWSSLLTMPCGATEVGLWDVSSDPPRETALVHLARELATGVPPSHPVLHSPGWWQRRQRLLFPEVTSPTGESLLVGPALDIAPGPYHALLADICASRGLRVGTDNVWARVQSDAPGTLRLHWLGHAPLEIRASAFLAPQLAAGLDLLMDGEEGLWEWQVSRFQPLPPSPSPLRQRRSNEPLTPFASRMRAP
ncbi:hypothetical protein MF271_17230 (plasmid) [Deinococcus sp. KNUC1210]|uniref:hypothetical protein n=1 Tax=Deinococcus sp. KNUC1210 TaxID=2917691 RepID=UPI001EEFBD79|nr:hypothetical protein [Deinococcus sp. KNUC1210]ULH17066.1 hypothetical protein MF271_17230 [Deinococcus sp. KNUC1210]